MQFEMIKSRSKIKLKIMMQTFKRITNLPIISVKRRKTIKCYFVYTPVKNNKETSFLT